ncbi:Sulfite efflux pump SSU1 [Hypsizygus marmoreus]|uniref:Sulfite efflux pump SSU1 n=1 Tax=Hypsizygus marmoreus TaxID=39966 RepID=A0A369J4K2_HYPMA|nr:Sulfite efflux pump SSU1 [Hypsizygus marmoreus]
MACRRRKSLKECIRNFTPAWFTVIMGTGVVSSLAARFHFGAGSLALEVISLIFFFLNLALFVLLCGMTIARYWLFPEMWSTMLSHPAQSLFVGAFPMGAATLINSALTANQSWGFSGTGFLYTLWAFWWLDLWLSFFCAFGMLYAMMTTHHHSLAKMASVWVLPMVTLIVASSTGGLMGEALIPHSVNHALISTAASFTALIIGLSLAVMIITVYLTRLVLHGPPDVGLILSAFIALGPLGQGGFSFLINGQNLAVLLPLHLGEVFPHAALTGQMLFSASFCAAWILWSMGVAWVTIAIISVYAVARKEVIPFSLAYWGLIFPNGVFALLSVQLGAVLESPFFYYFGAIWSILVLILWIFVFIRTLPMVWDTTIFIAPCLAIAPVSVSKEASEARSSDASSPTQVQSPA